MRATAERMIICELLVVTVRLFLIKSFHMLSKVLEYSAQVAQMTFMVPFCACLMHFGAYCSVRYNPLLL